MLDLLCFHAVSMLIDSIKTADGMIPPRRVATIDAHLYQMLVGFLSFLYGASS